MISQHKPSESALAISYLRLIVQLLEEEGINVSAWLAHAGIKQDDLLEPNGFVSFAMLEKLVEQEAAMQILYKKGIELGKRLPLSAHGVIGHLTMAGETYADGLMHFMRFVKLRTHLVDLEFTMQDLEMTVTFSTSIDDEKLKTLFMESAISGSYHLINEFIPKQEVCLRLTLPGEKQPRHQDFLESLYCPLDFRAEQASITMNLAILMQPSLSANPLLLKLAQKQCEQLLKDMHAPEQISRKVLLLLQSTPEYSMSQQKVADCLNMSTRTLRRKLSEEGVSYRDLADKAMKEHAALLLEQKTWSIPEIAEMLGYSEEANFAHAFKRWFGISPSVYLSEKLQA